MLPLTESICRSEGGERTDCLGDGLGGQCKDVWHGRERRAAVRVQVANGGREVGEEVWRKPPRPRHAAARGVRDAVV